MSNRNFDSSAIIQRLKDRTIAQSIYKANQAGIAVVSNPQNSNPSPQVIMDGKEGAGSAYMKNLGSGYNVSLGGTCN